MTTEQISAELSAMDPAELALGAGVVGALAVFMLVGAIVWFFLSAIGFYKMNIKAGDAGWKAFIPYYRTYVRCNYAWSTKYFWILFPGSVICQVIGHFEDAHVVLPLIGIVVGIVVLVYAMKLDIRVAKSFGKTTGWGVLLFFFPFIVSLILGFGKAQYIGNTTVEAAETAAE